MFMFSNPGHLLFEVAGIFFFISFLLVLSERIRFVRLRLCDSSVSLACITSQMHTSASLEVYVHINAGQAEAEGNTLWLLQDNLTPDNNISSCAFAPGMFFFFSVFIFLHLFHLCSPFIPK